MDYIIEEIYEIFCDTDKVLNFIEKHKDDQIFIFGFTFMIWKHFLNKAISNKINLDFSKATIIHGGGWKKLINEAVSTELFKEKLKSVFGISKVYDYYGMVEQTGSIYLECERGHLHTSIYSDVVTRRGADFEPAEFGEVGVIEVVSILPTSYPGHVLLTEDEGVVLGEDDCSCGRLGKYFRIIGRIKNAEPRGCSDTYSSNHLISGPK